MTDLKTALKYLLDNGYITVVNGNVFITSKLNAEIAKDLTERIEVKQASILTSRDIWDKFMTDACVPHKATATDGKQYTIRQFSPQSLQKLIQAIKQVDSYQILTEATKLYYKSNGYKLTFKNYLEREVWRGEYETLQEALKNPNKRKMEDLLSQGSGKNKFED